MEPEEREHFINLVKGLEQSERKIWGLRTYLNHPKKDKELIERQLEKEIKKKKHLEKELLKFKREHRN